MCVFLCGPLPSDRPECVSEVHELGVVSCVCVRACGGEALQ